MTKSRAEELLPCLVEERAGGIDNGWRMRLIEALNYVIKTTSKLEHLERILFQASLDLEERKSLIKQMHKAIEAIIDDGQIRRLGAPALGLAKALEAAEALFPELKEESGGKPAPHVHDFELDYVPGWKKCRCGYTLQDKGG